MRGNDQHTIIHSLSFYLDDIVGVSAQGTCECVCVAGVHTWSSHLERDVGDTPPPWRVLMSGQEQGTVSMPYRARTHTPTMCHY